MFFTANLSLFAHQTKINEKIPQYAAKIAPVRGQKRVRRRFCGEQYARHALYIKYVLRLPKKIVSLHGSSAATAGLS
ncbi:MAG: hypothetical protein K2L74_03695 [Muribaculaceae bacterium]|nr:hypothetical protein [Muribaculaceae bacterium]